MAIIRNIVVIGNIYWITESTLKIMDCCERLVHCGSISTAQGTLLQTINNITLTTFLLHDNHHNIPRMITTIYSPYDTTYIPRIFRMIALYIAV